MEKRHWRFLVPVLVQVVLLAAVPAKKLYTLEVGTTVLLKLAPVDPYDVLSRYYLRLSYEISRPPGVESLSEDLSEGDEVYVRLVESAGGIWEATDTSREKPTDSDDEAVWIRGRYERNAIVYGIKAYYIPEAGREQVEKDLREHFAECRAEVKVDEAGDAALVSLHIGDRVY